LVRKHELVVDLLSGKEAAFEPGIYVKSLRSFIKETYKASGCLYPLLLELDRYTRCSK